MVDLPTPEERENERQEHLAMFEAQTETQLSIIEELQRMSSRLDDLERRNRALATPIPSVNESTSSKSPTKRMEEGQVVTEALVVLGASLLWVVTILGLAVANGSVKLNFDSSDMSEQGMTSVEGRFRSARWFGSIGICVIVDSFTSSRASHVWTRTGRIVDKPIAPDGGYEVGFLFMWPSSSQLGLPR